MSTPTFKVQTISVSIIRGQGTKLVIPAQDADGNPIDISTGFAIYDNAGIPSNFGNGQWTGRATTSYPFNSSVFSAAGTLTLLGTPAYVETHFDDAPSQLMTYYVSLTNDSGTTRSLLAVLSVTYTDSQI